MLLQCAGSVWLQCQFGGVTLQWFCPKPEYCIVRHVTPLFCILAEQEAEEKRAAEAKAKKEAEEKQAAEAKAKKEAEEKQAAEAARAKKVRQYCASIMASRHSTLSFC